MNHYPQPEAVFRYFSELAAIPHGSGNTDGIRAWLLSCAGKLGLDAESDSAGNVIMRKAASPGYESHPRVILQGHMDMVCAKLPDCTKNMETEGLDLVWDDEFLSADGTTLGGDDGIALAYALAVLESDEIPHPPLTAIFTVDEETGMDGANGLSPAALNGRYLINLDSEEEGIITVGCAGGIRVHLRYPVSTEPAEGTAIRLTVSGLTGGHSGAEIHKPLLNANLVMLRLLRNTRVMLRLSGFDGGLRDNVIPTECTAELICSSDDAEKLCAEWNAEAERIRSEYPQEIGLTLKAETVQHSGQALSSKATAELLRQLAMLPNGVQAMDPRLDMPQTSLNLAIFRLHGDSFTVDALLRSSVNEERLALAERLCKLAENAGGSADTSGSYPAWEYLPDTVLEHRASAAFQALTGKAPVIQTIHAGLECGILAAKAPQLECISIGPNLLDIHTPRERLSLASAKLTWEWLLAILKAL